MDKNANLHRDPDGTSLCATIADKMGDVLDVGGVKGTADKLNSEARLCTLGNVGCDSIHANVSSQSSGDVLHHVGKPDEPEVLEAPSAAQEEDKGTMVTTSQPWSGSGSQISNGMGLGSALSAEDSQGGASKLVNNQTDELSSPPATHSTQAPPEATSEATKLAKPTQLCPDGGTEADVTPGSLSEGLPSGSDRDPSLGAESRSVDSLESFSNLNSCPSSEGLEDRGLALALQNEFSSDGTKTSCAKDRAAGQSIYHIKWIKWREENTPIITQNENGPCPLLAIMNVLLLAWKVHVLGVKTWEGYKCLILSSNVVSCNKYPGFYGVLMLPNVQCD